MVKIVFAATLPNELLQSFLQTIRDFDMEHDPNHEGKVQIEMLTESDWPVDKMAEVLSSFTPKPQFMYVEKFDKTGESKK